MDRKQAFSLFIIISMVLSIVSYGLFFTSPPTSSGNPNQHSNPNSSAQNNAGIRFNASNIESTVDTVFPRMIVTSPTTEAEGELISDEIVKTKGFIALVRADYSIASATQNEFVYIAEFLYSEEFTAAEIFQSFTENTKKYLTQPEAISLALIKIPKIVKFENTDLNLSIEHSFTDPLQEAYVSINTIKGDKILVSFEASFVNETLFDSVAFEEQNTSNQLEQETVTGNYEITLLENKLLISANQNYSDYSEQSIIESKINAISDINNLQLQLSPKTPSLTVFLKQKNTAELIPDLNFGLSSNPNISSFQIIPDFFDENKFSINIDFIETIDFISFKQSLIEDIKTVGFEEKNFDVNESVSRLIGEISFLEKTNIEEKSNQIITILNSHNFFDQSIKQTGEIHPETLIDFTVNEPITAIISPGHSIGDTIEFEISLFIQRQQIVFGQALEERA